MDKVYSRGWFYHGLVLASIPAAAYLLAFMYEFGYASVYNIPIELISLSTTQFCIALIAITTIGIAGFYLFNTVFKTIHLITYKHPRMDRIATSWSVWIVLVIILLSFADVPFNAGKWLVLILIGFLAIADFALIPLVKKMNEKLSENEHEYKQSVSEKSPIAKLERLTGIKSHVAFTALVVLLFGSFFLGVSEGQRKHGFMVTEDGSSKIVLRIYDGNMIIADFDTSTLEVSNTFQVLPVGNTRYSFTFRDTGRVHPPQSAYRYEK